LPRNISRKTFLPGNIDRKRFCHEILVEKRFYQEILIEKRFSQEILVEKRFCHKSLTKFGRVWPNLVEKLFTKNTLIEKWFNQICNCWTNIRIFGLKYFIANRVISEICRKKNVWGKNSIFGTICRSSAKTHVTCLTYGI